MSAIAYTIAAALIGSSAAVASQFAATSDAPVAKRVEIAIPTGVATSSYDFDKFATEVVAPVAVSSATRVEHLKPVRVAALGQEKLKIIVRDEALAQKADSLAAAATTNAPVDNESFVVTGEEIEAPSLESPAIVPVPKVRPAYAALQTQPTVTRKRAAKRKLRRPIRVAEANTTRQSRLAKRLRSKGWLIGAFR